MEAKFKMPQIKIPDVNPSLAASRGKTPEGYGKAMKEMKRENQIDALFSLNEIAQESQAKKTELIKRVSEIKSLNESETKEFNDIFTDFMNTLNINAETNTLELKNKLVQGEKITEQKVSFKFNDLETTEPTTTVSLTEDNNAVQIQIPWKRSHERDEVKYKEVKVVKSTGNFKNLSFEEITQQTVTAANNAALKYEAVARRTENFLDKSGF